MKWLLVAAALTLMLSDARGQDQGPLTNEQLAEILALSQEHKEQLVDLAMEFIQCAALFYASYDVGNEADQHPDDVQLSRDIGNGASLTAQFFLLGTMLDWQAAGDYVEDQVESNRVHWRSRLRGPGGNPVTLQQAKRCHELNPTQAEVVGNMRRGALSQPQGDAQ
jgi:hypothetical protein